MRQPIVWRYEQGNEKGECWFIAFLDEACCFAVLSDFGDYSYRWSPTGIGKQDFRDFITSCNSDYLLSKFCRRDEYQSEATVKAVKQAIIDERIRYNNSKGRHGLSAIGARDEWDGAIHSDILATYEGFASWALGESSLHGEVTQLAVFDYPIQARMFMERVWPRLKTMIDMDISVHPFSDYMKVESANELQVLELREKVRSLDERLYYWNQDKADTLILKHIRKNKK
jgi:hypothetical protein